jgi:lysophospholipase L1-like esterase
VNFRRAWVALICLIASGCVHAGSNFSDLPPPGSHYVAMGSSFAAGAGIGPIKPGTPVRCGRTQNNYASLLADKLELILDDQSCGGAKTDHILGPWDEVPAQIDAITPDTQLVTVTIGGNDLNYAGKLFSASCSADGKSRFRPTEPCPETAPVDPADYVKLEDNLRAISQLVQQRAPEARVVFVQYVTLVPDELCEATPLSINSGKVIAEIASKLAVITRKVADETGAHVLAVDQMSRGHTPCDAIPWATGLPLDFDRSNGAAWHPNAAGHLAIAKAMAAQ